MEANGSIFSTHGRNDRVWSPVQSPSMNLPRSRRPQPKTILVSCSADINHAGRLRDRPTTYTDSPEPVRGRDYVEMAVPGAFPSKADLDALVTLVTRFTIEKIMVITHSNDCGLVEAVRKYLATKQEPREFGKEAKAATKSLLLADIDPEKLKKLTSEEIAQAISAVIASNIAEKVAERIHEYEREDNPELAEAIGALHDVRISAYSSFNPDRHPSIVVEALKAPALAEIARQQRASAELNLGIR